MGQLLWRLLLLLLLLILILVQTGSRSPQSADSDSQDRAAAGESRRGAAHSAAAANADGFGLLGLLLEATQGEEEGEHGFQAAGADVIGGDVLQAADRLASQHMQTRVDVVKLKQRTGIEQRNANEIRAREWPTLKAI